MKKLLFLLSLFITYASFAQLENNHWAFGYHAGAGFTSGNAVASTSGIDNTAGGGHGANTASVSDINGNLLFYTDGIKVWDKTHNVMVGGMGLLGAISVAYDKQSVIIVPKPLNENLYYIFYASISSVPGNISGFYYSVVNMDPTQYGGNGFIDPTLKNIPLKNPAGNPITYNFTTSTGVQLASNCMSSTLHKNKDKIWLAFFGGVVESGIVNTYCYEYLISSAGIGTALDGQSPGTTNSFTVTGPNIPAPPNSPNFNYIKFSPDGSRLSYDNEYGVVAYLFDNEHGTVSIPQPVYMPTPGMSYTGFGLEFSPNNNLLYFSTQDNVLIQGKGSGSFLGGSGTYKKYMRIRQYDFLGGMDISVIVGEIELPDSISPQSIISPIPTTNRCSDLQLGRDGIIYVSLEHNSPIIVNHLAGILLPNNPGATQCGFSNNVMNCAVNTYQLGKLPQWVHKATASVWPKSYSFTRGARQLTINPLNNHLLVQYYAGCTCFSFQHNHAGVAIPTSGTSGNIRIHYDGNNAYSNYYVPDGAVGPSLPNMFCNNSGELLTRNGTTDTKVFNFGTGQLISSLPFSDEILAQTSTNKYLTISATNVLNLVDAAGAIYYSVQLPNAAAFAKYDKANDILYYYDHGNHYSAFQVFATTIGTLFQQSLPTPTPPSGYIYNVCSITGNGIMYYLHDLQLMKYDPATFNFSMANFAGLNNNSLTKCKSSNPYIDNKILLLNSSNEFIYLIDHLTGSVKKINYQNGNGAFISDFSFDNVQQNIFLTGITTTIPLTIGNQNIPTPPGGSYSVFVTKLNLNEFSLMQTEDNYSSNIAENISSPDKPGNVAQKVIFDAIVSPNPAKNWVSVRIPDGFSVNSMYTVSIYNNVGVNVLEQRKTEKSIFIDLQKLNPGLYFMVIRDEKGNRSSKSFVKN